MGKNHRDNREATEATEFCFYPCKSATSALPVRLLTDPRSFEKTTEITEKTQRQRSFVIIPTKMPPRQTRQRIFTNKCKEHPDAQQNLYFCGYDKNGFFTCLISLITSS